MPPRHREERRDDRHKKSRETSEERGEMTPDDWEMDTLQVEDREVGRTKSQIVKLVSTLK